MEMVRLNTESYLYRAGIAAFPEKILKLKETLTEIRTRYK